MAKDGSPPSSTTHVDPTFFDPEGVDQLRRRSTPGRTDIGKGDHECWASTATLAAEEGVFDFEKIVEQYRTRTSEAGHARRELGVAFSDLRVEGLGQSATYQPTVGSVLNPARILEAVRAARNPPVRDILQGFEGVVCPGEMLLVLGRPGSGCSTLLKTLANRTDEYRGVYGERRYDAWTPEEMASRYRGDVLYCEEDDVHFPTLTVDETVHFATKTRAPRARVEGQARAKFVRLMTDVLETTFGLRHAKKTPIGNQWLRGVSGGEKKRVSISEALASRALVTSWDNSTRGLDSSTALEFCRALRIATDYGRLATIVSIYQAGEPLYKLFDKVCVIYEGHMAYFGPARDARQYFIGMGYEPANRQTTADFLVAVTDPHGRIPRSPAPEHPVPRTAPEFAEYFMRSPLGRANKHAMRAYVEEQAEQGAAGRRELYKESVGAERARHVPKSSPYTISVPMMIRAVMIRRVQILKGNIAQVIIEILSFIIQATVIGTVFLQLPVSTNAFYSRGGLLFFSVLFAALSTMAEIPALFAQRPIILKHFRAAMYHPFIEALAMTLVDVPITFFSIALFSLIIYFVVGLQQTAEQFFVFFLFVFSMTITMRAFFRAIASAFRTPAPAQAVAGIGILGCMLYAGYVIPKRNMVGALGWITWINPLHYGFEAIVVNEFHTINATCADVVPSGPGYDNLPVANKACATVGSQPGSTNVDGNRYIELAFGYSYSHLWRNFGITIAFLISFVCALLAFTQFNRSSVAGVSSVTLFKRGSDAAVVKDAEADVEDGAAPDPEKRAAAQPSSAASGEKVIAEQPPMTDVFSWQHIRYSVNVQAGERQLLNDVSGYVAPGKLTALMGESGAGKTTLLNALAERFSGGTLSGDRFVNGQPLPLDFQAQTGYCQQMDTHLESTTVREALLFSAKMRQPQSVPLAEKEAYVETCLKMCGLEAYADAIVGSLGVERRKRTTIGVELAAKPKLLLFLDEPTSGLDSQSAWAIVEFLRSLANSGQAILCTIHQPSAELFQQFDRLLLLRKGGETVYFGDLGHNATTLIEYFNANGARAISPNENPAEWLLEVIGAGATATSTIDWHATWNGSKQGGEVNAEIERIHEDGRRKPAVEMTRKTEFATSWGYQLWELAKRDLQYHWRDPTYILAKMALNIMGGLFIGFTFWQSPDSQQGTQNKLFSIYMSIIVSVPLASQIQVPFIHMRDIYEIRERPSRMYSWTALVTSQILVSIPWNVLGASMFFFCWYWTVGYESSRAGYTYLLFSVIFPIYYGTCGQWIAALAPNAEIAALLFSFLYTFPLTFNGVMEPFRLLRWWKWMYRIGPFTYLVEGLLGQAIGHQEINCADVEFTLVQPPSNMTCEQYLGPYVQAAGGYIANPSASSFCEFCSTRTTDEYMSSQFNIYYANRWRDLGVFVGFAVLNVALIYLFTWTFRIRLRK